MLCQNLNGLLVSVPLRLQGLLPLEGQYTTSGVFCAMLNLFPGFVNGSVCTDFQSFVNARFWAGKGVPSHLSGGL